MILMRDGSIFLAIIATVLGVTRDDLANRRMSDGYREMMITLCDETRNRFERGRSVLRKLPGSGGFTIDWFSTVGLRLLKKIERVGYATIHTRPVISKSDRLLTALQSVFR